MLGNLDPTHVWLSLRTVPCIEFITRSTLRLNFTYYIAPVWELYILCYNANVLISIMQLH